MNALIVFYLLDRLRELAEIIPVLSRLILLLEMSAGVLMIGWLRRASFTPFAVYRVLLGAFLLWWVYGPGAV